MKGLAHFLQDIEEDTDLDEVPLLIRPSKLQEPIHGLYNHLSERIPMFRQTFIHEIFDNEKPKEVAAIIF